MVWFNATNQLSAVALSADKTVLFSSEDNPMTDGFQTRKYPRLRRAHMVVLGVSLLTLAIVIHLATAKKPEQARSAQTVPVTVATATQ
jgi:hypothetical protein